MIEILFKINRGDGQEFSYGIFVGLMIVLFLFLIFRYLSSRGSPVYRSYRISLLGPPGAGKTTSLICYVDQAGRLFDRAVIRVRGEGTIVRVARGLDALSKGGFPDRTSEESTDVYRFDYKASFPMLYSLFAPLIGSTSHFRVEMADFAGEHTEKFFDPDSQNYHIDIPKEFSASADQNFLKWISESDRCILYIDCEKIRVLGDVFINAVSNKYISLWQRYLDLHVDNLSEGSGTPVVFVFSKIDEMASPVRGVIPDRDRYELICSLADRFLKLIEFMRKNSSHVTVLGISAIALDSSGERAGIADLLTATLPWSSETPRFARNRGPNYQILPRRPVTLTKPSAPVEVEDL